MVTQRKPKPSKYLTIPTRPVQVDRDRSIAGLLEKMEGTGFGGRQLAESHRIWLDMLGDNTTIIMTGAGPLIPAGMRRLLAYVVKNRFVDVLVLSGSVIFHDLHETLGRHHFQAHPNMTDAELEASQISRMWDLLASEEEYHEAEEWVGGFATQFDVVQDVLDMAQIALRARVSGVINIGGGIAKSFLRGTEMSAHIFKQQVHGHKYAIQFSADAPHPGGRSSAVSFDESIVYGKLARGALTAYVNCDATIALPIVITALSQTAAKYMKGRRRPSFTFSGKDLIIDVP